MQSVVVRYGEIALKSQPVRRAFERQLVFNLKKMLVGVPHRVEQIRGRIFVQTSAPKKVARIVSHLPGVVSCSPALVVRAGLDEIVKTATRLAKKNLSAGQKFAVRTRRQGKHEFTSREVSERVGSEILRSVEGVKVDLSKPDVEIFIEIWDSTAYVFAETLGGVGGFPVGTQGKVLLWFSGKNQDVKAAFPMLKKGCSVQLFAFKNSKIFGKAKKLLKHHHSIEIYTLPTFSKYLSTVPTKLRPLIRRRTLVRLGSLLAVRTGARALVFADDANFLVSHKLGWIELADKPSSLPVFRPLLGEGFLELEPRHVSRKPVPTIEELKRVENSVLERVVQLLNGVEKRFLKVSE